MFVRWDNLRMDGEEERNLPGYRDPAVVRHFDAPEALNTNFYEVRAKSALNRVPKASRMPFRWTINPYRGCSHSCTYCSSGDTPILMADGRHKPLVDITPGDRIYGTVRGETYRHYAITEVLDHWRTVKPAYRITLEDGTELVASGDHRFLSNRGWKHVIGAEQGPLQRPFLTPSNRLIGTGRFAEQAEHSVDYKRGYLCGMIRGDGSLGSYAHERTGRTHGDVHRFRLALVDFEALRRAREFLADAQISTDEFLYRAAVGDHREVRAIRTQARARVEAISDLIAWPGRASLAWSKGFLAGIFDAEGGRSRGTLRISNTDQEIIDWTTWCLRRFGFAYVVEDRKLPNGNLCIRLTGGLSEHLRFFHTVDPAITRKRSIAGMATKCKPNLHLESIEPVGEMELYDITTGTGDFIANGVVSHNCFARPTHTFLDFNAREDFERQIVVKVNAPELVRAETRRPSWKRELVALGTNTDPYQWVEGRYKLMPGIWEALRDSRTPCSVLTKSPLVTRDIALLKEMSEMGLFSAAFSVPTIDEKAWRASEPRTPNPYARLEAAAELSRNGIAVSVLVAPLMPGINDDPRQVEKILELAADAGVVNVSGIHLHLRGEVKDIVMDWLESYRPDLIPRYEQIYRRGAYAPTSERDRVNALVNDGWAKAAPNRKPETRYVRTADDPASHRVPEAAQEDLQAALF
jgi:DNA repair photolyase